MGFPCHSRTADDGQFSGGENNPVSLFDLFHNDVKRGKRDVRRNLIGLKRTSIIAEPIKFRVSSWKPRLTSL